MATLTHTFSVGVSGAPKGEVPYFLSHIGFCLGFLALVLFPSNARAVTHISLKRQASFQIEHNGVEYLADRRCFATSIDLRTAAGTRVAMPAGGFTSKAERWVNNIGLPALIHGDP